MKKPLLIALVVIALVLVLVIVGVSVYFIFFHASAPEPEPQLQAMDAYLQENWPGYESRYEDSVLTLSKEAPLTYEDAVKLGSEIYRDELAPETYVGAVRAIAMDIAATCGLSPRVILAYVSTDGQVIFSVSSDGAVETCWEGKPE